MRVYLLGKEKLDSIILPEQVQDQVQLNEKFSLIEEYPLVIEGKDNKWHLKTTDKLQILSQNIKIDDIEINNYQYYILNIIGTDKNILLYTLPLNDINTYNLKIDNIEKIKVGKDADCEICYRNAFFEITKVVNEGTNAVSYQLKNLDLSNKVYVNNLEIQTTTLKVGDIVFSNGFRMIYMGNFININNPNNQVYVQRLSLYEINYNNTDYVQNTELENNINLYEETDYFYHTLRMDKNPETSYVEIEAVPGSSKREELPFILTMGSTLTMGASSIMMGYSVATGLIDGSKTIISSLPTIIMCVCMIIGSLILPRMTTRYQNKQQKKKDKIRKSKYTAYLNDKANQIIEIKKREEQSLKDNNPSALECYQMISSQSKINNIHFWCREITDQDFLMIRLGNGNCEAKLVVTAPEKKFTLEEDELLNEAYKIADDSKMLHNIPITLSLLNNKITGIIINNTYEHEYINSLVMQLVTLHSAIDLKVVILTNEHNIDNWDYAKYLPHCWSDDKETRYIASSIDEINEISSILSEEYKLRKSDIKVKNTEDEVEAAEEEYEKKQSYKKHSPYYLIINDDYNLAKNSSFIDLLLKTSINYGFSYLCIGNRIKEIPNKCDAFIEVTEKTGTIIENKEDSKKITKFNNEYAMNIDMREVSNKLANIPIMTKDGLSVLPSTLTFLEMLKVSKIEQLNILSRWKNNNPVVSLQTTVGVHTNGEDFKLDLHEKFHGPHGLIAGSTGSGKSEFIITYILSMAVNYHPYEVQFVLIDYKGGGLAGAFENKETGVKIPHLIGTITNLDTAEMNRTLVSIQSELKRRQRVFNEVRDQLGEGTIDIYKYQRLYREGVVEEPMAHLFIISDEFAELKSQQPEFMQQLISTARIGRSLGVHLILATQKPSGVVNDQIWSNSKFKVCLKVQDRSDSMEMLKRPEAASIKETGRFYLQVGYNDYFDIGQSGWSGAKYVPSDRIIKKIDDSINFVNNVGYSVKTIKDAIKVDQTKNLGDQLTNIVKYIYDLGIKENIVTKKLWLDSLQAEIYLSELKKKYNYKPQPYYINPVIGEYDNPNNQEQGILNLDLTNQGNTLIYGQTGSGKENLLSTIIWSIMAEHTPDEVNMYIVDCGSETLKMFYNIPHVGEVSTIEDVDLTYDIFEMLIKEVEVRKNLFKDYAGSYKEYCQNSGKKLPLIVTIINNYEIFVENFSKLSEGIQNLYRDGSKYGIVFIISAVSTNAVRSRIAQNFSNNICLQIPNESDYRTIVNAPRGLFPSKFFGRGLVAKDDTAYEFQTALFAQRKDMTNVVREVSQKLNSAYTQRARKIPVIPKVVTVDNIVTTDYNLDKMPIGFNTKTKQIASYNFKMPFIPIITKVMTMEKLGFIDAIIQLLSKNKAEIRIIDFANAYESDTIICYKKDFDNAIVAINNEIVQNKNTSTEYYYIFLGIGQIRKYLTNNAQQVLEHMFNNISGIVNCHFLFFDTYDSYKNLQLETWYQLVINPLSGIWLGDEVGNQLVINIPNLTVEDKKLNFPCLAYTVVNGDYKIIKHVTKAVEDKNEE